MKKGKKILLMLLLLIAGILSGYLIIYMLLPKFLPQTQNKPQQARKGINIPKQNQVIGFLPFWLIDKADSDYSKTITTLSYFNLNIDSDGKILTHTNPREQDPGWYTLTSGKVDTMFNKARQSNMKLSLTVFAGDESTIEKLISDPINHANNLVTDIVPIMQRYGFSDLNIDIESAREASPSTQANFTQFIKEVKTQLSGQIESTITIDLTAISFVKDYLIKPQAVASYADNMLLMAYDFHNPGSFVTGPVSPLSGAGIISEFDIKTVVNLAIQIMPSDKLIVGLPLYGYEWETLNTTPRSAVIPGTSQTISNSRVEDLLKNCTNCTFGREEEANEPYIYFKDPSGNSYHQIFYPDSISTQSKIDLVKKVKAGGVAVWALGYEGDTILSPLMTFKDEI